MPWPRHCPRRPGFGVLPGNAPRPHGADGRRLAARPGLRARSRAAPGQRRARGDPRGPAVRRRRTARSSCGRGRQCPTAWPTASSTTRPTTGWRSSRRCSRTGGAGARCERGRDRSGQRAPASRRRASRLTRPARPGWPAWLSCAVEALVGPGERAAVLFTGAPPVTSDPAASVAEALDHVRVALPALLDLHEQLEVGAGSSCWRTAVPAAFSTRPPFPMTMPFCESRSTRISQRILGHSHSVTRQAIECGSSSSALSQQLLARRARRRRTPQARR